MFVKVHLDCTRYIAEYLARLITFNAVIYTIFYYDCQLTINDGL